MRKVLQTIFNVFWIIFCGIGIAINEVITGALCCLTIIGIPFGLQHFKFIKLGFAPFGKKQVPVKQKTFANFFYVIIGGLTTFFSYFISGLILCLTIVGIPLGIQLFKFATFHTQPFGSEIINNGEFTSTKNTFYDTKLLINKIKKEENKNISIKGENITLKDHVKNIFNENPIDGSEWLKKYKKNNILEVLTPICGCSFLFILFFVIFTILLISGPLIINDYVNIESTIIYSFSESISCIIENLLTHIPFENILSHIPIDVLYMVMIISILSTQIPVIVIMIISMIQKKNMIELQNLTFKLFGELLPILDDKKSITFIDRFKMKSNVFTDNVIENDNEKWSNNYE